MPIFDVLKPKENQFFSDLIQGAEEGAAQDLNVLLSQPVVLTRFSLDYNPLDYIKSSFKQKFVHIKSQWEGEVTGVSSILICEQDAKAMSGLLMMEPINAIKENLKQPLGDEDMEIFQEIANQINGSIDNGLRKGIKFDFHLSFDSISMVDFSAANIAETFGSEGYVYARANIQVADLPESFILQLFPIELITEIKQLHSKELEEEEAQREKGDLRTVLLVDNDEIARKLLKKYLKDAGYVTLDAEDGMAALGILRKQKVDCIIMEIDMPNMSGLQVCERVKANPNTRKVPVIIYSGQSTKTNIARAIKSGATDFFVKPVKKDFVLERVAKVLL